MQEKAQLCVPQKKKTQHCEVQSLILLIGIGNASFIMHAFLGGTLAFLFT
jgi:hypothetical protein